MKTFYSNNYKIAMNILKELRLNSNMTQQELSSILNCDQTYISKYESGQRRLDIIEIYEIVNALGFSLSEFSAFLEKEIEKGESSDE